MDILLALVMLVAGFVALVKGADWFVDGTSSIAARLGIPQLVIGLTIVAMGTSAPEAAVSITASFAGSADITVGNVLGSNIMNILVILGLASLFTAIRVRKSTIRVEIPFMIGVSVVILLLGLDGMISRLDGVILWALFLVYLGYLFWMAKKGNGEDVEEINADRAIWKSALLAVIGLALIVLGSDIAVEGASRLARMMGLSERLIGLTIVALGTSLPELCTSVAAARRGNADIAIGNIVGSNVFNILFVVGTSSLINPIPYAAAFTTDALVAIAAAVLLLILPLRKKKLTRAGGILMLACYAAYFFIFLYR